jgi:hypothetical protein
LKQFDGRGNNQHSEGRVGAVPTQHQAATDAGISERQRKTAVRVANIPANDFETAIESDAPPTVTSLADMGRRKPLIDLQGRDPEDYNKALHFIGALRNYEKAMAERDLADLLPRLIETEKQDLRAISCRIDQTARVNRSIEAGVTDRLWEIADIAGLAADAEIIPKSRWLYTKRKAKLGLH